MNIDARGLKFSQNVVLIGIYVWEEFGDTVSRVSQYPLLVADAVQLLLFLLDTFLSRISRKTIVGRASKFSQNVDLMYTGGRQEFGDLDLDSF